MAGRKKAEQKSFGKKNPFRLKRRAFPPDVVHKAPLSEDVRSETNPEWKQWFMEVERKRDALRNAAATPWVYTVIDKENESIVVSRRKTDPELVKKFIPFKLPKNIVSVSQDFDKIQEVWKRVVGAEIAEDTRFYAFKNGILTIEVFSSILLQELRQFHYDALLSDLRSVWPIDIPLVSIKFRNGKKSD